MEKERYTTVNWIIENFSNWRLGLHGECIYSPNLSLLSGETFDVELYPRDLSGTADYLTVKISETDSDYSGEMTFIGSDGSIICTQQVDYADRTLKEGPKFIDVYALIKRNEEFHKDKLTLRFQFHQSVEDFEHLVMTTTIDVQKASLTVNKELIENIEPPSEPKFIFRNQDVSFKTVLKRKTVEFTLEPPAQVDQCFLVETFISVVNSDNTLLRKEDNSHEFSTNAKTSWTFSDSLDTELFQEGCTAILRLVIIKVDLIENFATKICNKKSVGTVRKSSSNFVSASSTEDSVAVLTRDFMRLYQDQEFSDFQLKCGTASFPSHKNILSARSPVFKRLLSCDMKEATSGCMEIVDLDTPTLARFLAFLYTGAVEEMQDAFKLYYAADKYQVPSLKKECTNYLCANVSISNVCDVLSLVNKHQERDLAEVSRKFVLEHYNEVLKSKEWESFIEKEPWLAVKIVTDLAAKDCVGKKLNLE